MIENLLWVIFGVLSALVGVLAVYLKNSQKIIQVTPNKQNHHSKIDEKSKNNKTMSTLIKMITSNNMFQ